MPGALNSEPWQSAKPYTLPGANGYEDMPDGMLVARVIMLRGVS
jgi:hypothetical protein